MTLAEVRDYQEQCQKEFQERLERYYQREEEAQREFNQLIYGSDED